MMPATRILIVDDDRDIRDLLTRFLEGHGFAVAGEGDGVGLFASLEQERPDLVILDLMLPGEDGLALCRKLRQSSEVPVIMLTALGEEADRIVGLEVGADDYIAKPFSARELLARIRAVLRRTASGSAAAEADAVPERPTHVFRFAGWKLDTATRELLDPDGALVSLTGGEYGLLLAFLEHPGRVLSRDLLLDLTRGREAGPFDRAIDVQLSRLRRKIEPDPKNPTLLKTVRGGGYVLAAPVRTGTDRAKAGA